MKYDDDDLIAFHMGTLDPVKADALIAELSDDDALARRLMDLDPAAQMVSDAFKKAHPQSGPVMPKPAQNALWRPLAIVASTLAASLAVWSFLPATGQPWHRQVAAYQVLYTTQTISMIASEPSELEEQFAVLDAALSIDFDQSSLTDVKGLDLLRAQLLGLDGAPLGQIVFADHLGRPVALCLMSGPGRAPLDDNELSGLNTISWGSQTHQFLLVGPVPKTELQAWAEALQLKV